MRKNLNIDNIQTFRQAILHALSKLNDPHTQAKGEEEFRDICDIYGQDLDRISLVISILNDSYERDHNIRLSAKKEYIKLYGVAAEIYGFKILEFFPKILQNLNKKLKEQDNSLHVNIGESFGALIEHSLKQLTTQEALPFITQVLSLLFQNFQSNSKFVQTGSAIALSRVIQSCPLESLYELSDDIMLKINECLQQPQQFKAQSNILEALLSVLVGIEQRFRKYCQVVLPLIINNMTDQAWSVRKIAVDIIYTLAILMPNELMPFQKQCIDILNQSRFDKIKHVRDASIVALNVIKELNQQGSQQQQNDNNSSNIIQKNADESSLIQMNNDPLEEMMDQQQGNNSQQQQQQIQPNYIQETKQKKQTIPVRNQRFKQSKSPYRGKPKYSQGSIQGPQDYNLQQKESIFKGPKNSNFFKNAAENNEVQILVKGSQNQNNIIQQHQQQLQQQQNQIQNQQEQLQQQNIQEQPYQRQQIQKSEEKQQIQQTQNTEQSIPQESQPKNDNYPQFQQQPQQQINTQQSKQSLQQQQSPYQQKQISYEQQEQLMEKFQELSEQQEQMQQKIEQIQQEKQNEVQALNKRIEFLEDLIEKVYTIAIDNQGKCQLLQGLSQQQSQQAQTANFQFPNLNNNTNTNPDINQLLLAQQLLNNNNNNQNNNQFNNPALLQQQINLLAQQQQQQLTFNNNNSNGLSKNTNIRNEIEKNKLQIQQLQEQQQLQQQDKINEGDSDSVIIKKKRGQWDVQRRTPSNMNESLFKPSEIIEKNMQQQKQTLQQLNNDSSINFNDFNFKNGLQQQQQQKNRSNQKSNSPQQQQFNNYMQPPKRFSPSKDMGKNQQHYVEHNVNDKIVSGIQEKRYNEVYGLVLISNDDKLIIDTMEKTGICVNQLDDIHLEFLLTKLKSYLFRNEYVEESVQWIYATICEFNIKISSLLVRSMRETLKRLLDNHSTSHFMNQKDVILVQKILKQINDMLIE